MTINDLGGSCPAGCRPDVCMAYEQGSGTPCEPPGGDQATD